MPYELLEIYLQEYQIETSLDEKLRQTVHAVMNAGLASGAPEVLYSVQNYHKRAMEAIKSPTPNVNCDVILIRPQMAEHEFCQQNNDYKWKEVRIMNFISFLKKRGKEISTIFRKRRKHNGTFYGTRM